MQLYQKLLRGSLKRTRVDSCDRAGGSVRRFSNSCCKARTYFFGGGGGFGGGGKGRGIGGNFLTLSADYSRQNESMLLNHILLPTGKVGKVVRTNFRFKHPFPNSLDLELRST